ncbi:prolyl oligopeptidase family serine peptidase [Streptacidiphilus cavernicola]|uniref:Prolyl oligopeptidase family serine peptidase n=1 Tax=Streptacidiphilus cavernicola TaxID=3342716 RepID=A0ABV6VZ88_9ACTN
MSSPAPGLGYQVYRPVLPLPSPSAPHLMVFTGDADGRCEVFTWDGRTSTARQVTDRPHGTLHCAVDADGAVWWFDEDLGGTGRWQVQPFGGGPDTPALTGVAPGRHRGLAMSAVGTVAMGLSDGQALTVTLGRRGGPGAALLRTDDRATLIDLSPDGGLLVLGRGAASERAVTVLTSTGRQLATLSGREGRIWALGFAPAAPETPETSETPDREPELLLVAESDSGETYHLASWTRSRGLEPHRWCAFDSEITAHWYPGGRQVLVRQDRHGRSRLLRVDLDRRSRTPVAVPAGTVLDAAPRADGDLHYLWTDAVTPPRAVSLLGAPLPGSFPAADDPGVPGRTLDLWTPGPDGPVHTLVTHPDPEGPPPPLVFLVHGGPADHDRDAYDPAVHSLVASGFAVARVNYRGSTGYGPRWCRAFGEGVGLTQVADLARVRADLLDRGLARPDAVGLWGVSWGAYLVLLALGSRPGLWQAGVAVKPIADCAMAFADGTAALRALDAELFGGTPAEVPERYARSSPSSYAAAVRAPLLLVAARRDVKCPPAQVEAYLAALRAHAVPHLAHWLDTGHDGHDGGEHVEVLRRAVTFLGRTLLSRRTGTHLLPAPPPGGDGGSVRSTGRSGQRDRGRR